MSIGRIAVRYARALFLSAREQKLLDEVKADMELFLDLAAKVPDIGQLLENPILVASKKASVLAALFTSRMCRLSLDFIDLVTRNNREEYLPGMARYFIRLYKEEKGIQVATISSAVRLDDQNSRYVREMIEKRFRAEIELQQEIREDLIGGFVLRVENRQLDASVKGKLARIKKKLQE